MNWQELTAASLDDVVAWAELQPWARAMADCPQEAAWHAEGDVWTHTKMVCRQLTQLDEWSTLTDDERTVLLFVALLHDAAKPLTTTTDLESGRITSPKHAVRGEHLARGILRDLGCDLTTREEIARLVRYHGRPAFLLERSDPSREVIRLSWLVSNRLLYLFALADTRGRDTDSMSRPEENLHFWKLVAEEARCYETPFRFASDHARFVYFRSDDADLHYEPHENHRCVVTLLSGLPGSGKDTWLRNHHADHPIVSLDDVRQSLDVAATDNQGTVVQAAKELCRGYLRSGTSFAFNATNLVKETRSRWISLFADYNARINVVYVEPPLPQILRQNQSRPDAVPEQVIRKLADKCDPPTWTEGHGLTYEDGLTVA